jgi:hypothetical protein
MSNSNFLAPTLNARRVIVVVESEAQGMPSFSMMTMMLSVALMLSLLFTTASAAGENDHLKNPDNMNIRLTEPDRLVEYRKRNYTWPLNNYQPNTDGWKRLMEERFAQVAEMDESGDRYEGYIQTIHSAFLVPNFTEHGFGLARCPDDLLKDLQQGIRDGLPHARHEKLVSVIEAPEPPLFIDRPDLTARVLSELQPYAETWSGIKLTPYRAYGFRLYQNHSSLAMHVDKMQSHIVSFILHIGSSDDAQPWPIFIEDYLGRTHEVYLTPGDMLFYESSKCFHGRPRRFNGSWYTSVFVHYYPETGWWERNHKLEAHYAVPPHWNVNIPVEEKKHNKLQMLGTSMSEPDCPDTWCRTQNAIKWSGPGEEGFWISPNQERYPFHPPSPANDEL